jgi:hypothetical protein
MKNNPKSRREFLFNLFSNKIKSIPDLAAAIQPEEEQQSEKIKMLTPDGKLVEVDSQVIKNSKQKTKAGNAEILKWMEDGKDKS